MATGKLGEAAAIGVPDPLLRSALVLVCVPKPRIAGDSALRAELSNVVVHGIGIAFRPKDGCFISDLPKTRNLNIMRRVTRAAYLGKNAGDLSSLVNLEVIDELRALATL